VSDFVPDSAAEIPSTPYAKQIATHLGQDHIDRLTQIFVDIGVAQWLEQYPFSRLELTRTVFDHQRQAVNGLYSFKSTVLQIATQRSKNEFGKVFEWGRVHSVSSTGELQRDAVQRTLIHELGHHIHKVLLDEHPELFDITAKMLPIFGGTAYAKSSWREYFPETFALYVFFGNELALKDPAGYGIMEQVLKAVGLEVKQQ
jgi:hypothetical protein